MVNKNKTLNNMFVCVLLHFAIITTTFIASVHFWHILFAGLLLALFLHYLSNQLFGKLFINILSIFVIEILSSIQLFMFIVLFIFLYIYLVPRIKLLFSLPLIASIIYTISVYFFLFLFLFFNSYDFNSLLGIVAISFTIDIILIGLLF